MNSVDARAKEPASFAEKAATPSEDDPNRPKYEDPLVDITDLAGVRIITFFPRTIRCVGDVIRDEFDVLEHTDHTRTLRDEGRFGYQSEHFLVKMRPERTELPEYKPHAGLVAEIQVRTILQHAWAEIEHDIQYKSPTTTPLPLARRIMALAGLLEIADREFQAIQDADEELTEKARSSVVEGRFERVEITANALKSYLDSKIGADARVGHFSYESTAQMLRRLGFSTIDQVEECIEGYDDNELCRIQWGWRQGPIWRFQSMLLAGMGETFVTRRTNQPRLRELLRGVLQRYKDEGVPIRDYDPQAESA